MGDGNPIEIWSLAGVACATGVAHTLLGPDHYLPFAAMSKAGKWTFRKTMVVTWLCGIAHIASSILLGFVGIALGLAVFKLEGIEEARGGIAGWLLVGFGLAYFVWGVRQAILRKPHSHVHLHPDGTIHDHSHNHQSEHLHVHQVESSSSAARVTPWLLFTIFFLGPCEPLIPLFMYPAAESNVGGIILVAATFGLATLLTMTIMVTALVSGFTLLRFPTAERYGHAIAGLLVLACGVAIKIGL